MPYKDKQRRLDYWKAYREKHRAHRTQLHIDWRERNREHWEKYQADYRARNRAARNAGHRARYEADPDKYKNFRREWGKRNPDWRRNYYHKNRQQELRNQRASYMRHRGSRIKRQLEYHKRNPHVAKLANMKRRAIKSGAEVNPSLISEFIKRVRSQARMRCYYCPKVMNGKKLHIDHIVALARGGKHSVENLCAACPTCNRSKHDKPLSEWQPEGQKVLNL